VNREAGKPTLSVKSGHHMTRQEFVKCYHSIVEATRMPRSPALADRLNAIISGQILSGERVAGSRLPTETQLAEEFGVSRTVVREAIARLRSDGLVVTRQGLGAFVAESLQAMPFRSRIEADAGAPQQYARELFELRLGLETEAAALAAERASPRQAAEIGRALDMMVAQLQDPAEGGVEADLQFHRAIAMATNNGMYQSFLAFLERHLRQQLVTTRRNTARAGRIAEIETEHRKILAAILAHDPDAAREAMRRHLRNGIDRLVTLGTAGTAGAARRQGSPSGRPKGTSKPSKPD
jgi:GntR family transcriptional repressor for pyruvate dehydrogenase complex